MKDLRMKKEKIIYKLRIKRKEINKKIGIIQTQ
jgi:hypothetical protein